MSCRTIRFFILLCGYAIIVRSNSFNRNSFSKIQVKSLTSQNEDLYQIVPSFRNGKVRTERKIMKRDTALIVNDDFDLPPPVHHHYENSSESSTLDEEDGSGVDAFHENGIIKMTSLNTNLGSEFIKKSSTTISTQSTTAIEPEVTDDQDSTSIDSVSSGDGMIDSTKEHTTLEDGSSKAEVTTKSHITPGPVEQETIPDTCMNSTCSANDLSVWTSDDSRIIAEGTNYTFSCNSNEVNQTLYWYKTNGSLFFLQAFGAGKLHLTLTDTRPIHSGNYICVRWINEENCCILQSNLKVYEVPLYKYHLIILGLVVAVCLLICIVLSIRQSSVFKSYTKQFQQKHGSVKKQLL